MPQSLLTTLLDPSAFLPILIAWTTWELNTCMAMFISTTTLHVTYSATSIYSAPQHKVKRTTGEQHSRKLSSMVGLAGGKPTILVIPTIGRQTSSVTEVADEEVCLCINLFLRLLISLLLAEGC